MKKNVLILSGGLSSRMGYPKAFLPYNENFTFLEKIIEVYSNVSEIEEVIVVLNSQLFLDFNSKINLLTQKCRFIPNDYPEKERAYSVYLGLNAFRTDLPCYIQNVDNPFIDLDTLSLLSTQLTPDVDCVIPRFQNESVHPILIAEHVVQFLKNDIEGIPLNQKLFNYKKQKIEVDNELLNRNINTFEEYEKFFDSSLVTIFH